MKNNEIFIHNKDKLQYSERKNEWVINIEFGKVLAEFRFSKKDFKDLDAVKKYIFEVQE